MLKENLDINGRADYRRCPKSKLRHGNRFCQRCTYNLGGGGCNADVWVCNEWNTDLEKAVDVGCTCWTACTIVAWQHVALSLSTSLRNRTLFQMGRPMNVVKWSEMCKKRLYWRDVERLLAVKFSALELVFKKSAISDGLSGTGILEARPFRRQMLLPLLWLIDVR